MKIIFLKSKHTNRTERIITFVFLAFSAARRALVFLSSSSRKSLSSPYEAKQRARLRCDRESNIFYSRQMNLREDPFV